jgi:hypothetical protein
MIRKPAVRMSVRMSVRILDEEGTEIASFFDGEQGEDVPGFSDSLRDALLGFREHYPETRFIDVEFKEGESPLMPLWPAGA